ncbi:hypothetical protein EGW08_002784 [Elysia chlorotica]|uniref:Uncharacterized protein n=1 Tax=Elysia chlorotica TaxID=188477 RepID=A0A3S1BR26_ELYCH|nr:hypothetical protein EGW08_002784 [Elysia chlorotica]
MNPTQLNIEYTYIITNNNKKAIDTLRAFSSTTTLHGLNRAMNAERWWRCLFWWFLLAAGTVWSVYNVHVMVRDFQRFPVLTSLMSQYDNRLSFPAITLCNLNRFRSSRLPSETKLFLDKLIQGGAESLVIERELERRISTFTPEVKQNMSHHMEDMLIACSFNMVKCDIENFTKTVDPRYGNCYRFSSYEDENNSEEPAGLPDDSKKGLLLEMTVQSEDYLALSDTVGLLVLDAHSLRKSFEKRLRPPYGECEPGTEPGTLGKMGHYKYSIKSCYKECLQLHIYKKCECCEDTFPCQEKTLKKFAEPLTENSGLTNIPACNHTNRQTHECVDNVSKEIARNNMVCSALCQPSCEDTVYSTQISTGRWPSKAHEGILWNKLVSAGMNLDAGEFSRMTKDSLLRLRVFYNRETVVTQSEEPAYTWSTLLGNIGGQLGLLLGFSLMTGVEILELLLDLGPGLWLARLLKVGGRGGPGN